MASEEAGRQKRRRVQNACDLCRKRKVKCDSMEKLDNICTNCIASKSNCTHLLPDPCSQRAKKEQLRVEQLKARVETLEQALRTYVPHIDLDTLDVNDSSSFTKPLSNLITPTSYNDSFVQGDSVQDTLAGESVNEEYILETDAEFEQMHVFNGVNGSFFGSSSTYKYVSDAIKVKQEYISAEYPELDNAQPSLKRPEFWGAPSYERAVAERQNAKSYQFPPGDLLQALIDAHFRTVHCTTPILFESRFRKNIQDGLHHRDIYFGGLVMMVCALSSRYSDDPRVLLPGEKECSAGWMYYEQVQVMRHPMLVPPTIHELQTYCLAVLYSLGTSAPHNGWALVSLGIRFCHDLGIHRKKPPGYPVTVEEEERKRVFWHLVGLDRFLSFFVGRPSGYRDEDFDADFPAECDDEYIFEDSDGIISFQQPLDRPSRMEYLTCMGRLQDILSLALRALYSTDKSRIQMGLTGKRWKQDIISELDSALNRWLDTIPGHLRWSTTHPDRTFFIQSGSLYVMYNIVQIQIHRPFLGSRHESTSSSIICASSARFIAGILGSQIEREDVIVDHGYLVGSFMAALTLLMNIWHKKQRGIVSGYERDINDVNTCKAYLRIAEKWWFGAGRCSDLIEELTFAQEISPLQVGSGVLSGAEESSAPPSIPSNDYTASNAAATWSTNYIPQYGSREDFPSISMQIPAASDLLDRGLDFEPEFTEMDGQLLWQAPLGFNIFEWDEYISRMAEELSRNQNRTYDELL